MHERPIALCCLRVVAHKRRVGLPGAMSQRRCRDGAARPKYQRCNVDALLRVAVRLLLRRLGLYQLVSGASGHLMVNTHAAQCHELTV